MKHPLYHLITSDDKKKFVQEVNNFTNKEDIMVQRQQPEVNFDNDDGTYIMHIWYVTQDEFLKEVKALQQQQKQLEASQQAGIITEKKPREIIHSS